jgi:hypothetical protein
MDAILAPTLSASARIARPVAFKSEVSAARGSETLS